MSATSRTPRPRRHGSSPALGTRPWLLIAALVAALIAPVGVQAATAAERSAAPAWLASPTADEAAQPAPSPSESDADAPGDEMPAELRQSEPAPADPVETVRPAETAEQPGREDAEPSGAGTGGADADDTEAEPVDPEPSALGRDGMVSPMAVPTASGSSAVINVRVRGDRNGAGTNAVAPLAGVTLRLYNAAGTAPVNETWATCVSDAQGDCSFTVPETQAASGCFVFWCTVPEGTNRDRRFTVVQESAPAGWFANPTIRTGTGTGTASQYRFLTGSQLRAGTTYSSGSAFMGVTGNMAVGSSSGMWQNSRVNPTITCGPALKIALVLDLSGSVDNYVTQLRNSAKGLVDGLAGSGTSLALFTFADHAPRNSGSSGRNYDLLAIDAGDNLQTIKTRIDAYQTGGGTNWDRGIHQVATSATAFDIAIVITDGMPTFYGADAAGPGSSTRIIEAEHAIFSANALKAQGTRVLAVGVGDGTSGNPANLAAISGQNGFGSGIQATEADYFQTSWQDLQAAMADITRAALCQATVEVTKLAQPWGQQSPQPASGWPIGITATAPATFTPGGGTTHSASTGADGTVMAALEFPDRNSGASTLTISETLTAAEVSAGWALESVTCSVNGMARSVTISGTSVQLAAKVSDDVECTFVNVQTRQPGIEVVKHGWSTASATDVQDPGSETAPQIASGGVIADGTTVTWTYDVTNTGQTVLQSITVVDDRLAHGAVSCPATSLAVGHTMRCTATAPVWAAP